MRHAQKTQNKSPSFLQYHRAKQEVTEALKDWNQDGPCRVVVLHLSLLIHCCIDCVFIWRGNEGELMSEPVILASVSPSSPVSYLAGCSGRGRMPEELPATLIAASI